MLVAALLALPGCGDDGGATGGSGGAGTGAGPGSGGALPHPAEPHTPATGCKAGYQQCGDVCAHLEDDARHCGDCDAPCMGTQGCVAGECVEGQGCLAGTASCGDACVKPSANASHCGSCDNRCADSDLCVDGACAEGGGDGTSCDAPLFWDFEAEESVGFHMSPALSTDHTFECGPLEPIQTRWFRVTATMEDTDVEIRSASPDDYVLEMFADPGCPAASLVACSDDDDGALPKLTDPPTMPGGTYWIAVGIKGKWSGTSAELRGDH
jgi:hypothetical protein